MKKLKRLATALALLQFLGIFTGPTANAADQLQWSAISSLTTIAGWRSALSSDGSTIVVGKVSTGVYVSTNSGSTYSAISAIPTGHYYSIAVSGDGQKILVVLRSSNTGYYSLDRGSTWTTISGVFGSNNYATCMSGDGSVWMNGSYAGSVYLSTNNGSSWSTVSALGTGNWWNCSISYDGSKRQFNPSGAALKYSTDSGATWSTSGTTVPSATCLASNDSASKIIMGSSSDNKIYISNNSGATFTASYTTSGGVYGCASSSDGSVMLAANNAGALYASLNGGSQWNLEAGATATSWGGISISSDGTRAIALPSVSGSSFMGLNLPPTSLVISSGNISIATYRTSYQLTATSNYSGRVTFYANGKKIANCISIPTISLIATCNYSPSMLGAVTISGKIVPTNTTYAALTTELFRTLIKPRKTLR